MAEPSTTAELQARIASAWDVYMNMASRLSPSQVDAPGTDGWTPKDQVSHVAAWERTLAAILDGEPQAASIGLTDAEFNAGGDEVNELIRQRFRSRSWDQVLHEATEVHRLVVERVARLTDEDLRRDLASFTSERGDSGSDPILQWFAWETYEHYEEHGAGFSRLVDQGGAP